MNTYLEMRNPQRLEVLEEAFHHGLSIADNRQLQIQYLYGKGALRIVNGRYVVTTKGRNIRQAWLRLPHSITGPQAVT